jgi:Raf kinase inhibitor-like YbhB/YbcL family protein
MNATESNSLSIFSVAFSHNGSIPKKYTCEGENVNPPLEIGNYPKETKTFAIIVEDPDAPSGTFDHLLVWNIVAGEPISEEYIPGIFGKNSFGDSSYGGPCPPSGTHRYFFKVYALDNTLDLQLGSDKNDLLDAMKDHVLATGELMGHYKKTGDN